MRWIITEHAVDRYIERARPGISREMARSELELVCDRSHFVSVLPSGVEQWREPKPRRMRLRVERTESELRLVSVIEAFDGLRKRC